MRRAPAMALALAALVAAACGVKAPPRPSGAPDKAPPSELFRPADDPNRPSLELEKPAAEPAR